MTFATHFLSPFVVGSEIRHFCSRLAVNGEKHLATLLLLLVHLCSD